MQHNRITINQAFAKSNREGKDELLRFFDELREMFKPRDNKDPMWLGSQLSKEILKE